MPAENERLVPGVWFLVKRDVTIIRDAESNRLRQSNKLNLIESKANRQEPIANRQKPRDKSQNRIDQLIPSNYSQPIEKPQSLREHGDTIK